MDINKKINELIVGEQYSLSAKEKEKEMFPILLEQLKNQTKNKIMDSFYKKLKPLNEIKSLLDVPPIPVSLFKENDLSLVSEEELVRTLTSSGTTSQIKSKIPIDKTTSFRQSKALANILKNHIGKKRKPMLIIDTEEVNNPKNNKISARGVAIRGIAQFGKDVTYILDGEESLILNQKKLEEFAEKYKNQEIIIFGFTYIVWTKFHNELKKLKKKFNLKAELIHSGGWKKLESQKVSKEVFGKEIGETLGISPTSVYDMYGMVEQVGVVFIDCEKGNKHMPNFAEVIIRNPLTMNESEIGETGLIEILSVLPSSYPGQALITEDIGLLAGVDDCECGRKGKYFRFVSRVEKSEIRGCGDTFMEGKNDTIIF